MNGLKPIVSFQITCDFLMDQNYNSTTACKVAKLIPIFFTGIYSNKKTNTDITHSPLLKLVTGLLRII
jgi:hypothetical protein